MNLDHALTVAVEAVTEAGRQAQQRLGTGARIDYKGAIDLVTEVDRDNERLVLAHIQKHFPDHDVVAEEGGGRETGRPCRWYVDPLDGTVNFAHNLPWFAVSAAMQVEGVTEIGAIYLPMTAEIYTAKRGGGAFCNGQPIRVSDCREMRRALLGTGFPYDVATRTEQIVAYLSGFLAVAQGVRRVGSCCLDLCQVASGRYDGFWELGLHEWDVAAGFLLVREAGGRATDFAGHDAELLTEQVLVSNGHLHGQMLDVVGRVR